MRANRGLNYIRERERLGVCVLFQLEVFFLSGERTRPIKIKRTLRPRVGKVDVKRERDKCVSHGFV